MKKLLRAALQIILLLVLIVSATITVVLGIFLALVS